MPLYHEQTYNPTTGVIADRVAGSLGASGYETIATWNWGPCNTGTQRGFVTPNDVCFNNTPLTTPNWFPDPNTPPPGTYRYRIVENGSTVYTSPAGAMTVAFNSTIFDSYRFGGTNGGYPGATSNDAVVAGRSIVLERQTTGLPENDYRDELEVTAGSTTPATYASVATWSIGDPNTVNLRRAFYYNFGASSGAAYRTAIYASNTALTGATPTSGNPSNPATHRLTVVRNGETSTIEGTLSNIATPDGNNRVTFYIGDYSAWATAMGASWSASDTGTVTLERQTAPGSTTPPTYQNRSVRRRDLTADRYVLVWNTDADPNARQWERISEVLSEDDGQFIVGEDDQSLEAE